MGVPCPVHKHQVWSSRLSEWELQIFVSCCVFPSSFPYQNVALHSCVYSSNCSKPGLKIPLDCLAKRNVKRSQESLCGGDLHIGGRLYICWISIQSSGFTRILPHPYTHTAACCSAKCLARSSRAAVPSSVLILVKGQTSREPPNSVTRLTLEKSLEMPFPLSTLRAGFNCPPFVANGGRGGDIRPFLAAPFSQGSMHSIRGF